MTGQPLPSSRRDRRRPAERSLALPVLIVLAATPLLALASSPWLPARVASHYTAGVPDASSPVAVLVLIIVVVGVVPVLGWLALGRMLTLTPAVDAISFVALMSYAVIGVAGLTFGVLVANLGVPTWSQARSPQWAQPTLAATIGAGFLVSILVAWCWMRRQAAESRTVQPGAATHVADDAHVVWMGQAHNRRLLLFTGLGVIVALCIAWWSTSPAALVTAALLMIASLGSRTEAIFDGRFLRARIGIIGPWRTIPVADITDAEVVHVSPAAWFGYGLRWRGREQAFVVRTGPGLRVQLRNRLSLVMSLDDPATGVQLIRRAMDTGRPHPGVP